ncbi:hypothetical protein C9374_003470 [Naegleria lovaniensis]|uniref:Uncharacterized protein n=1 Tax=Naegleria lovaniensis TaxID=51637 RepID=A0AA88GMY8_NAELO|nr:uncharacterized protein C9374_003470 [Naegleria lovaniensis]KAG2385655.1 hypothetical protein C9374_003470 [Naegleria lovaniensis]
MVAVVSLIAYLVSLLSYRFLSHLLSEPVKNVFIGAPALTFKESLTAQTLEQEKAKKRISAKEKQKRALEDFFRDTGGKVTDLRVLRSAMYLSDEIDKAVRGIDDDDDESGNGSSISKKRTSYVGWRPYNRFYAEGTEELFTNVPTGRSPLVMAAPTADKSTMLKSLDSDQRTPLPIEYQAMRRSHLKLVGRQLKEFEQEQLKSLQQSEMALPSSPSLDVSSKKNLTLSSESTESIQSRYQRQERKHTAVSDLLKPRNDQYEPPAVSDDLRVGAYQRYQPLDSSSGSIKKQLLKFEGDISERRPDLDYKFEME